MPSPAQRKGTTMIDQSDISRIIGADVYGADGTKIGTAGQVYLDNATDTPEWISVRTGLFGTKESFVPLSRATFRDDRVDVPFDKETVKGAPQIEVDGDLSPAEEHELYFHYGMGAGGDTARTETARDYDTDRNTGRDTAERDVPDRGDDGGMTRSEERLNVDTRSEEAGRARLRKYVVTEQQQVRVPVSREEVRLEREPITDANRGQALDGPAISEEEHEGVLHEERPGVEEEAVPVERGRLGTETVTDQQKVTEEVLKEQIDTDGDGTADRR